MPNQIDLFQKEEMFIKGKPVVTIFHNSTNLFSIVKLKIDETNSTYEDKEIIVTGYFPQLMNEDSYHFT